MATTYYVIPHTKVPELIEAVIQVAKDDRWQVGVSRQNTIDVVLFDFSVTVSGVKEIDGDLKSFENWCKENALANSIKPAGINVTAFNISPVPVTDSP